MSEFVARKKGDMTTGVGAVESPYNLPTIDPKLAAYNLTYQIGKEYAIENTAWGGPRGPAQDPGATDPTPTIPPDEKEPATPPSEALFQQVFGDVSFPSFWTLAIIGGGLLIVANPGILKKVLP